MAWGRRQLVVTVRGLSGASEADGTEWFCVLSCSKNRFETRPIKLTGDVTWDETFIFSSNAINQPPPVHSSSTAPPPDTSTAPPTSPKLHLEVWASKRWGSPSIQSAADLPLGPFIPLLTSSSSTSITQDVLLDAIRKPSGRRGQPAAGMHLILELLAVPEPHFSTDAVAPQAGGSSAPTLQQVLTTNLQLLDNFPVLHTQLGHLYRAPAVQVLKLTLQSAGDLHNLLIDPQAAAAAVGQGGFSLRLASIAHPLAAGSSSGGGATEATMSEAAALAKQRMQAMTASGQAAARTLFAKTNAWLRARKESASVGEDGAGGRLSPILGSTPPSPGVLPGVSGNSRSTTPDPGPSLTAAAGSSGTLGRTSSSASTVLAQPGDTSAAASPRAALLSPQSGAASSQTPAASGKPPGAGAAAAADVLGSLSEGSSSRRDSGEWAKLDPSCSSPRLGGSSPEAPRGSSPLGYFRRSTDSLPPSLMDSGRVSGSGGGAHARMPSEDADAVMAMLEDNGFHASDAPGGNFFYVRLTCGGEAAVSRMVGLGPSGEAVWGQAFWFALPRPVPADAQLTLELYSSRDSKSRGRVVTRIDTAVSRLLDPAAAFPDSSGQHFKARHLLQGTFSANLSCTLCVDVEAVDTDTRAAHLPRAAPAPPAAVAPPSSTALPPEAPDPGEDFTDWSTGAAVGLRRRAVPTAAAAAAADVPHPAAESAAAGGGAARGSGAGNDAGGPSPAASSAGGSATPAAAGGRASGGGSTAATNIGLTSPALAPAAVQQQQQEAEPNGAAPLQPLPPVAELDLVVKSFDLPKPLDCFWVLQLGPYWAISSGAHSTASPAWHWGMSAPVSDSSWLLSLEVFRREDQSGGKRVVSVRSVLGEGVKPVGRLKVRLSTLLPNQPLHLTLPLQGERHNLRGGRVGAAAAHLYLHLRVPALLDCYLPHLFRVAMHPPLYLLLKDQAPPTQEAVSGVVQRVATRWLETAHPSLPGRITRRLLDDGRVDFTLSRTRHNWRRLLALRDALAPAGASFSHICSWEAPGHSLGVYGVILALGVYPSMVLSLACAAVVALLLWRAWQAGRQVVGSPPGMEPDLGEQEDSVAAGTAVPTDPATALKQNYDGVVGFLMTVQNVLDNWAAAGERLQLLLSWRDPVATALFVGVLLLLCLGLATLGLRVLVTCGLLWMFRHPVLRNPYPPPPVAFAWRLPTRRDTTL